MSDQKKWLRENRCVSSLRSPSPTTNGVLQKVFSGLRCINALRLWLLSNICALLMHACRLSVPLGGGCCSAPGCRQVQVCSAHLFPLGFGVKGLLAPEPCFPMARETGARALRASAWSWCLGASACILVAEGNPEAKPITVGLGSVSSPGRWRGETEV